MTGHFGGAKLQGPKAAVTDLAEAKGPRKASHGGS